MEKWKFVPHYKMKEMVGEYIFAVWEDDPNDHEIFQWEETHDPVKGKRYYHITEFPIDEPPQKPKIEYLGVVRSKIARRYYYVRYVSLINKILWVDSSSNNCPQKIEDRTLYELYDHPDYPNCQKLIDWING